MLGIKPVVYNPVLAEISESVVAGGFLSHLLYLENKTRKPGWVYKTIKEVKEETFLSRRQQETAIKIWLELKCLKVEVRGVPAKRYFHINLGDMSELFRIHIGIGLPYKQKCQKCNSIVADNKGKYAHKDNCPSLSETT